MGMQMVTKGQASQTAAKAVDEVKDYARWMAATWCVRDGKVVLAGRTTWNFPTEDFLAAVLRLSIDLQEEMEKLREAKQMLPSSPLPRADVLGIKHEESTFPIIRDEGPAEGFEGPDAAAGSGVLVADGPDATAGTGEGWVADSLECPE